MANINVNNNYGNIQVADYMANFDSHDDRQMEEWIKTFYPGTFEAPNVPAEKKLEASSIEAKLDALTEQIAILTSLLTAKEA